MRVESWANGDIARKSCLPCSAQPLKPRRGRILKLSGKRICMISFKDDEFEAIGVTTMEEAEKSAQCCIDCATEKSRIMMFSGPNTFSTHVPQTQNQYDKLKITE